MSLAGAIRQSSLRGVVLSYILSEPGLETVNTISEDLNTEDSGSRNVYRAVFGAVQNLEQRGFIKLGNGPNKVGLFRVIFPPPSPFSVEHHT